MSEQLSLAGAARRANVTVGAVRYWVLTGRLPAEKVGVHWVIDSEELDRVNKEMSDGDHPGRRGKRGQYLPLDAPVN